MSKQKPMSKRECHAYIEQAFRAAEAIAGQFGAERFLREAVERAERDERTHRRPVMGIRSRADYASHSLTARYFALKGFVTPVKSRSFTHRADFVAAYGAAEYVADYGLKGKDTYRRFCLDYGPTIARLEYPSLTLREGA